ncbi:hypothetical protein [Aestuariimicrobium sp. T2.26MG-19.2B]|uniref:hypothetical protein n=1 Tax=Aestuariimicrobium sp. T2.26MG-19.2B TaxID=3040679 RepID=UPI00253FA673|nr:hypothetical protein [Aestuariimicrobium sp. T2.26MG-19.2B]
MAGTGLLVLALIAGLGVLLVLGVVLLVVTLTRRREPESYGEPSQYGDAVPNESAQYESVQYEPVQDESAHYDELGGSPAESPWAPRTTMEPPTQR